MIPYEGKLAIFTTFYNYQGYSPYVRSLATTLGVLSHLGARHEYFMEAASFHPAEAANQIMTDLCNRDDFTDLLFIDADESWAAEDVVRLLLHKEEIVGASYRMKNNWDEYVGRLVYKDGLPYGKMLEDGTPVLLQADRVAAGFMRIKVDALRKWRDAYPEQVMESGFVLFLDRAVFDGLHYQEDMAFCRRWADIGGEMWIDPNIKVDHWGFECFKGDFSAHLHKRHTPKIEFGEDAKAAFDVIQSMAAEIEARKVA